MSSRPNGGKTPKFLTKVCDRRTIKLHECVTRVVSDAYTMQQVAQQTRNSDSTKRLSRNIVQFWLSRTAKNVKPLCSDVWRLRCQFRRTPSSLLRFIPISQHFNMHRLPFSVRVP